MLPTDYIVHKFYNTLCHEKKNKNRILLANELKKKIKDDIIFLWAQQKEGLLRTKLRQKHCFSFLWFAIMASWKMFTKFGMKHDGLPLNLNKEYSKFQIDEKFKVNFLTDYNKV